MLARSMVVMALAGCDALIGINEYAHPDPDAAFGAPCPAVAAGPDEDGDGCTDLLDNCPTFYNVDQADDDADTVGEACDPHPGRFGDSIVDVAYFATSIDGGWIASAPQTWRVSNGVATNDGVNEMLGRANKTAAGSFTTIELTYTALAFTNQMSMIRLTISDPVAGGVTCHIDYNDPTFDMFISDGISGDLGVHTMTHHVVFQIDADGARCSFVPQSIRTLDTVQPGPSTATIELINFKVALASIAVYQSIAP